VQVFPTHSAGGVIGGGLVAAADRRTHSTQRGRNF